MADAVAITKRYADPWTNLLLARERDIELVVSDGEARYGTSANMKAAGQTTTTSMRVGTASRHFVLRNPVDPMKKDGTVPAPEKKDEPIKPVDPKKEEPKKDEPKKDEPKKDEPKK